MKTRHITEHRQPAKGPRFAWSRQPNGDAGATTWWLFRRPSTTRRVLPRSVTVSHAWSRARIAAALRAARKELLDHADAIDLRNLGVTP
ncbi:hypothetical protein ASD78_12080 [Lysobacter sp. Root667]|uniref:hypothetical protein n=1 Tax=Lysobacter sp. Root667 TaxID=1736581 RepID=UPI0006F24FB3|nr:hypothetical protein [Lysobacter sp. Root667]KRA74226.1 hypothetical protein ASD78_12080 [Lysobacter sp. Root667]